MTSRNAPSPSQRPPNPPSPGGPGGRRTLRAILVIAWAIGWTLPRVADVRQLITGR